ncbi:MAG: helix-hairpin-helix domain-containing protein [Candidatus Omnitrophota bacterium]
MAFIRRQTSVTEKLSILSRDSRYDLACSCATRQDQHRKRSGEDKWIYPVALPGGEWTFLFKTLLSNECVNNCKYCPLRSDAEAVRCSVTPEEIGRTFLSYYNARKVSGLFLSSAVSCNPDDTMEKINRTALLLRKAGFRGYIHLKIIPGASDAAIYKSLSLATAVSLNIEAAQEEEFRSLSTTKDYARDIIRPIHLISRLTAKGSRFSRVKQTTQFVVGAGAGADRAIITSCGTLYKNLGLSRVYFSAYQRGAGTLDLPGEKADCTNSDLLTREHRLYQADWLIRKYGFSAEEIPLDERGNLSLAIDPKEMWAKAHPEFFPVDINRDSLARLFRVPGLGQVTAEKVLEARKSGTKIHSLESLGRQTKLLKKAREYIKF